MSYKIAVATSDNLNVNQHFGGADSFKIYSAENLDFQLLEERKVTVAKSENQQGCQGGCQGGDGGGCSGGSMTEIVGLVADCRAVVATKIGRNARQQLEAKAISVFDVDVSVNEALSKIVGYYYKIDNRKFRSIMNNSVPTQD
jgi:predicted Fe-Mo cluster-binding NifX family protein